MRGKQIIEEIDFLRSQGEGLERITEVIQQQTTIKPRSLRRLLARSGRGDLLTFLYPMPEPVIHEHGEMTSYEAGCRCGLCREANTAAALRYRKERAAREKDPNDPRHGKATFYANHGCRCDKCRAAHRAAMAEDYKKRLSSTLDPNDPRHGKRSFYIAWGCRCEPCRSAAREAERKRGK